MNDFQSRHTVGNTVGYFVNAFCAGFAMLGVYAVFERYWANGTAGVIGFSVLLTLISVFQAVTLVKAGAKKYEHFVQLWAVPFGVSFSVFLLMPVYQLAIASTLIVFAVGSLGTLVIYWAWKKS
ncbi:hypothetical protein [Boudabousia marimammalium]|uniref:Uncharacterized protein n=1 Tax=Boudabousia marimammalium TaxID=156892 RepID=A0A1Q5PSM4_9ACTO|nr:hypothetical protein [Boudabousia marimammalium]OKL50584.1 hypothetical protein BM477_01080 [Boudabousia marimammalium]